MKNNDIQPPEDLEIPATFPSMKSCSGGLKIPLRILKSAKSAGCPAFLPSNRVRTLPLLHWVFENMGQADATDWNLELLKARTTREKLRVARETGAVVGKVLVSQRYRENLGLLFQDLHRRFVATTPPRYHGRTVSEMADINERELFEIQESAGRKAQNLEQAEGS